ncbi:MAG: flagellar protein FliT [Gallionellaceae bacterium]|jgi:flagellar protein FliT
MNAVLEKYESLSTITGKMREAAAQGDWDLLVELEEQSRARVEEMKLLDLAPIDEATRLRKVTLIRKILADDAEIRSKTEPWMAQLQRIMSNARSEDRLQKAYSSGAEY